MDLVTTYPNSLCFKNKGDIIMNKSFFESEFRSTFISFDYCNNNTYSGKCKSIEQIDTFFSENIFYFGA